jgi:hypothetical protein
LVMPRMASAARSMRPSSPVNPEASVIADALYRASARMDAGWPGSFSLGPASLSLPLAR